MKGGLPYLYNLVLFYYDKVGPESSDISITEKYLDSVSSIILNIGNILYYLSISGFFLNNNYFFLKKNQNFSNFS